MREKQRENEMKRWGLAERVTYKNKLCSEKVDCQVG